MQPDASNDFLVTVLSSSNYKEIQTNVLLFEKHQLRVNVGKIRKFTRSFWKWADEAVVFVSWTDVELYFHALTLLDYRIIESNNLFRNVHLY
jgi:hypothetical protein